MTGDTDETDAGDADPPEDPPPAGDDSESDSDGDVGTGADADAGTGSADGTDRSDNAADTDDSAGSNEADGSAGPGGSGETGGSPGPGGSGSPEEPGDPGGPDGPGGPGGDGPGRRDVDPERVEYLASELADLQEEVEGLESRVADRTVHRDDIEAELRRYVRARQRRGHATGWGPYLVLLYGVIMTLGAFYYLGGIWAILAMIVVWLSTLGLYVVMAVLSTGISVTRRVAALRGLVGRFR
ncbi:hypothetical protein BRC70_06500 [Halobacteriales archaeon QH_6_68_27]|nr:MAG: hypothetical protein BRC70_06500 [Halobacteriales archaeon QH_6_68_27]